MICDFTPVCFLNKWDMYTVHCSWTKHINYTVLTVCPSRSCCQMTSGEINAFFLFFEKVQTTSVKYDFIIPYINRSKDERTATSCILHYLSRQLILLATDAYIRKVLILI